ncbi:MAG TPA: hypothetical protein PLR87_11570 [Thermoanaerobaculaceae bacterium]|nr:hypothetical protein [Thermoanaerobaculaceae bacterium]
MFGRLQHLLTDRTLGDVAGHVTSSWVGEGNALTRRTQSEPLA